MTISSSDIKGLANSNNKNPILKKVIRIGDTMFLAIHDSIVQELHIDEQRTWFEEIPTETGIILKISSKEIG